MKILEEYKNENKKSSLEIKINNFIKNQIKSNNQIASNKNNTFKSNSLNKSKENEGEKIQNKNKENDSRMERTQTSILLSTKLFQRDGFNWVLVGN